MGKAGGFTIVLIIVVILTTLFLCYGLLRLVMIRLRKKEARLLEEMSQPPVEAYAVPVEPIRVVLARDEEAAVGMDDHQTSKMTPPAYGAWRESVVRFWRPPMHLLLTSFHPNVLYPAFSSLTHLQRVDPNLLFWRRTDSMHSDDDDDDHNEQHQERPSSSASHRPPSYISDDGVSYVVDAEPRSTVCYPELPVHPSEVGRVRLAGAC